MIEQGTRMTVYITVKNHKTTAGESVCWVECRDLSPKFDTPLKMPVPDMEKLLPKGESFFVEISAEELKPNQDPNFTWSYKWTFIGIVDEPSGEVENVSDQEPPPSDPNDPFLQLNVKPHPMSGINVTGDLDRFRERGVNRRKALEEANKRYASQPPTVSTNDEITVTAQAFLEFLEE